MTMKFQSLEEWRNFFRGANASMFEIIDCAIKVAAMDEPEEFKLWRGQVVEKLYSLEWSNHCSRCGQDHKELVLSERTCDSIADGGSGNKDIKIGLGTDKSKSGGSEDSKLGTSADTHAQEIHSNEISRYSYSTAEALSDETDEENHLLLEVSRIKEILRINQDEAIEISKAVSALERHKSKKLRQLVQCLINNWKVRADELHVSEAVMAEQSKDSSPTIDDEELGLPLPPLDEGAFFVTQAPMELSDRFFDGMDEDGNVIMHHQRNTEVTCPQEKEQLPNFNMEELIEEAIKDDIPQFRQQESLELTKHKPEPSDTNNGPANSEKPSLEHNIIYNATEYQEQQRKSKATENRPLTDDHVNVKPLDDAVASAESRKRKNPEPNQHPENAKKQRDTQLKHFQEAITNFDASFNVNPSQATYKSANPQGQTMKINDGPDIDNKSNPETMHGNPPGDQKKCNKVYDDDAIKAKVEASRRKLKEGYLEAERARKQRSTRFLDFDELVKLKRGERVKNGPP